MRWIRPSRPSLQDPLVAQRNPFEVALLAWGLTIGIAASVGANVSLSLRVTLDPVTLHLWSWTLIVGCTAGLIGLTLRGDQIEVGFQLERFAMWMMCAGIGVFAILVLLTAGPGGRLVAFQNVVFSVSCAMRGVQITRRFWFLRHNRQRQAKGRPYERSEHPDDRGK